MSTNLKFFYEKENFFKNKQLLKQSYIILSWFYYLNSFQSFPLERPLRFFVFPTKHQIYTLTKAPIAHKTWSQEQYKFLYYFIRISFKNNKFEEHSLHNLNQTLLFIFYLRLYLPQFSTNLMLLKSINFFFLFSDRLYFDYYRFKL